MRTYQAYLILVAVVTFVAYFGVYGFYALMVPRIGFVWALAGAGLIAAGTFVIAAVGITMIKSRPPRPDEGRED